MSRFRSFLDTGSTVPSGIKDKLGLHHDDGLKVVSVEGSVVTLAGEEPGEKVQFRLVNAGWGGAEDHQRWTEEKEEAPEEGSVFDRASLVPVESCPFRSLSREEPKKAAAISGPDRPWTAGELSHMLD